MRLFVYNWCPDFQGRCDLFCLIFIVRPIVQIIGATNEVRLFIYTIGVWTFKARNKLHNQKRRVQADSKQNPRNQRSFKARIVLVHAAQAGAVALDDGGSDDGHDVHRKL